MKVITVILAFVFAFHVADVKEIKKSEKRTITVVVPNITSNVGEVKYALYNQETFMKSPLQSKSSKIENGKSSVTFENIEPGTYAVICFHDKNGNNAMDFEPNGMPKEDFGASNNVMSFGPPQFEDAKFDVTDKNVTLEIKF
ncbi:MAG: DUF2141 domain-containing protein [Flavobacteriaceae bacterium]|nr:DUF2141 domain-containing protein [Flavobacteriaceae bacterium]